MRELKVPVIILLLITMAADVFAIDLGKWKYRAEVTVEKGKEQYCRLKLTPEIYGAARPDLGDIRLLDASGEQVPYVIIEPKDITEKLRYRPSLINSSTSEDKTALVTLDFGKQEIKNSIEVETGGTNFRRIVKVEGSNDNIEFFTLVEQAYVFAIGDGRDRRFSKIDLPVNDYRYLRISVGPMATEEESPVIEEVKTFKIEKKLAERETIEMTMVEHKEDEKGNLSIYAYDLLSAHLPISEIELDVADASFYRYVTVEGRDAATRKVKIDSEDSRQRFREVEVSWTRIISDTIYRYTEANGKRCEKRVLHIPSGRRAYRYLKITVNNYDDKPIMIKSASVKMIAHKVVFAAKSGVSLMLYVGSKSASKPRYDLVHMLKQPSQVGVKTAQLGGIIDNPLFGQAERKVAWTERHKVLLLVIMGAMVLVLGWFILRSFKSIQSEQNQD